MCCLENEELNTPHLNTCMPRSSTPSTVEKRSMTMLAGVLGLMVGFRFGTSGALISTRPEGREGGRHAGVGWGPVPA